jgi:AcrR family transcriptional regulator
VCICREPSPDGGVGPGAPGSDLDRIRKALIDLVAEKGYEEVTIAMVVDRAGVPRSTFDDAFPDLESCVGWAYEEIAREYDPVVLAAFCEHSDWRDSIRAAAYTSARFIEERPNEVRFGVTEILRAGPMAQVVRERHLQRMVDLIDAARGELDDPDSVDRSVAEGVVGAIYNKITVELQRRRSRRLAAADVVADMMYIAVGPYFGQAAAREELRRGPEDRRAYERGEL